MPLNCHQGGQGVLSDHCLCPTTSSPESVLKLEHMAEAEVGQNHQAFMEAFGVVL